MATTIAQSKRRLGNLIFRIQRWYGVHIARDSFTRAVHRWRIDNGDETLRLSYPLSSRSVVFDVGGYRGDWSSSVRERYNPIIYIFEPVSEFAEEIRRRFAGDPKVHVREYGLSDRNEETFIGLSADATSRYRIGESRVNVRLRNITEVIAEEDIARVHLLKLNIEGGEYGLLEHMVREGLLEFCDDIQVQFHRDIEDALRRRETIRENLRQTHTLTYDYPFVWENWHRVDSQELPRLGHG